MTLFTCPTCSFSGRAPDHLAGGHLRCPECGEHVAVRAVPVTPPPGTGSRALGSGGTVSFSCRSCEQRYTVSADRAGKTARCKKCSSAVTVPEPDLDWATDAHQQPAARGHVTRPVVLGGVAAGLLALGAAVIAGRGTGADDADTPSAVFVPPPPPPQPARVPAVNDDVRALRESVERQEQAAERERQAKAVQDAADRRAKKFQDELDELNRWNNARHKKLIRELEEMSVPRTR